MCASYWNLKVTLTCPVCNKTDDWELQTHFMGYLGSCEHYYNSGEKVDELQGVNVLLDGKIDDFIGDCQHCKRFFDLGANIVDGKVEKVFFLKTRNYQF